ncbi:sigma-like protein [Streptomyces sp. ISL-99]|uniref:sigma-like protein n=1 Tax=Streptomyces sp. ISL-99 TaxID=2819193 RepID=UPI001BE63F6C|nr:sigma-like protein [Streptomyces sp. ISL-99]MBT2525291.1 sigma-like protein [Streptomyces sp. ISL-99]
MGDAKSNEPILKPQDQHATGTETGTATTQDQHATGGDATTQDQHATTEPA